MSGFSFSGSEEVKSSASKFLRAGIHDFEVLDMYHVKAGEALRDTAKKDGNPVLVTKDNIIIRAKVLITHIGGDSKDVETNLMISEPQTRGDGKDKGRIDRVFHILCNIATSSAKDKFKAQLESVKFVNFADIATKLAPIVKGRKVRYKMVMNDGKGPYLPSYFGGFAEPADVPFENTTLNFEVGGKEDFVKKEDSNVEAAISLPEVSAANFSFTDDSLDEGSPFDLGSPSDDLFSLN